jgi:nucleoside-triphosphatase THEP1
LADAIIGDVGGGKTTAATRIIELARKSGICVSGILSPRTVRCGERVGYEIVDVSTQNTAPWLIVDQQMPDIGPFRIVASGAALAKQALARGLQTEHGILVIDEIGPLELRGEGHSWALDRLKTCKAEHILLVARRQVTERLRERWGLKLRCWEPDEWPEIARAYRLKSLHS